MSDRRMMSGLGAFSLSVFCGPMVTNALFSESHKALPHGEEGNLFGLGYGDKISPGVEAVIYLASIAALIAILYCAIRTLDQIITKKDADNKEIHKVSDIQPITG